MTFQQEFPVLDTCTYLNTANSGILSQSLMNWRRRHDEDYLAQGGAFRLNHVHVIENVKNTLSRFFRAHSENIFMVPNFSFGFNVFLDGLSRSNRFLLLQDDYPSIVYPIQSRGFAYADIAIENELEENILKKINQFRPTVLVLSIVQYKNGIKIDLDFIKSLKQKYPEMIIVADGTQYCGTEDFDFEQSGIDVLIASGYKWLLAGYGNGFVMLKNEVADQLYADAKQIPLPLEPFLKHKKMLALFFEPGHQDTLNYGSLQQSILYLEQLGFEFIESKIKLLSKKAKNAFEERDLLEPSISLRKEHTSIFNLSIDDKLIQKIQDANIICSSRGKGLRVSFNFYNEEDHIERLLEMIDKNR